MKKWLLLSLVVLFSFKAFSQDNICESSYMPFKTGMNFELTTYDKKNKESSIAKHKVTELDNTGSGFKATVEMEITDPKGKNISKGSYGIECSEGVIKMDMTSMLDPRTLESFSSMEMELSGDALEIPNRLSPGQTLPDGTMTMKASTGGFGLMTFTLSITNRQVEAKESITTPAGTFDCVKITQDSELKSIVRKKFQSATWYAKGIGMVKSENYDSKGNVESTTLLTKLAE